MTSPEYRPGAEVESQVQEFDSAILEFRQVLARLEALRPTVAPAPALASQSNVESAHLPENGRGSIDRLKAIVLEAGPYLDNDGTHRVTEMALQQANTVIAAVDSINSSLSGSEGNQEHMREVISSELDVLDQIYCVDFSEEVEIRGLASQFLTTEERRYILALMRSTEDAREELITALESKVGLVTFSAREYERLDDYRCEETERGRPTPTISIDRTVAHVIKPGYEIDGEILRKARVQMFDYRGDR